MTPLNTSAKLVRLPLGFVDVGENLVMADDVITPSDSLVVPIEKENFEEMSLDVNVSQQSCEEEPFRRMVHT